MSQRPLATISKELTPTYQLPPALAAALGSLDVNLEDELIRYRRHRAGEQPLPPQGLERDRHRTVREPQPSEIRSVTAPVIAKASPPLPNLTQQDREEILSQAPPTESETALEEPTPQQPVNSKQLEETSLTPRATNEKPLELVTARETIPENASLAPLAKSSKTGNLVAPNTESRDPDDYLESSEELLKSLADDETVGDRPWYQSLLTPLGIGVMLLILTGCALFSFILANPSMVRHWLPDHLFNTQTPTTDEDPTASSPTGAIPQTPNLADREFTPITLDTLSTLETNSSAGLAPSTSPLQSTENQYFYVVTPYDAPTLEQVTQIIPDAYVRYDLPQGTQIQLGAFEEEYRAKALAEDLQNQGIAAAVYKP